jgi:hypothetical protein
VWALEALSYTVIIDRQGIHGAERWEARLGQMLLEADSVIFVLTPASAVSDVCRWEVDQALALHKRIVPVLAAPLGTAVPHPALRDLNYIFFYPETSSPDTGWGSGLARLHAALCIDIEWVREHTRVAEMAARWQAEACAADLLARGSELANLQSWRDGRPANAPDLTVAQRMFLQASEQAEIERQDVTRRQLEDMRNAQDARAAALEASSKAQDERSRALKALAHRTIIGIVAACLLSVAVGSAAFFAHRNGKRAQAALEQIQDERLLQDRLIRLARNRDFPPPPYSIDILARRYEGEKSEHVGTDFLGGVYYGIFRIKAGPQMDEYLAFLRRWARPLYEKLAAAGATAAASKRDPQFVEAWSALSNDPSSADQFSKLQLDFITKNAYQRIAARLAAQRTPENGSAPESLDINQRSLALRAVVFSVAVQYGPSTSLIQDALSGFGNLSRRSDEEIIRRLFLFRDKVEVYFPQIQGRSSNFAELIRERNYWEQKDALYILGQEGR